MFDNRHNYSICHIHCAQWFTFFRSRQNRVGGEPVAAAGHMCGVSPVQAASVFTPLVGSRVPKHTLRVAPRLRQSQMDLDGNR